MNITDFRGVSELLRGQQDSHHTVKYKPSINKHNFPLVNDVVILSTYFTSAPLDPLMFFSLDLLYLSCRDV